jgi:hypothetical protein
MLEWMTLKDEDRQQRIDTMHTNYIKSNCPHEVNIPASVKKKFMALKKDISSQPVAKQMEVLHAIYNQILLNIADTFSRFTETEEYTQYIHISLLHNALMDMNLSGDKQEKQGAQFFQYELQMNGVSE